MFFRKRSQERVDRDADMTRVIRFVFLLAIMYVGGYVASILLGRTMPADTQHIWNFIENTAIMIVMYYFSRRNGNGEDSNKTNNISHQDILDDVNKQTKGDS